MALLTARRSGADSGAVSSSRLAWVLVTLLALAVTMAGVSVPPAGTQAGTTTVLVEPRFAATMAPTPTRAAPVPTTRPPGAASPPDATRAASAVSRTPAGAWRTDVGAPAAVAVRRCIGGKLIAFVGDSHQRGVAEAMLNAAAPLTAAAAATQQLVGRKKDATVERVVPAVDGVSSRDATIVYTPATFLDGAAIRDKVRGSVARHRRVDVLVAGRGAWDLINNTVPADYYADVRDAAAAMVEDAGVREVATGTRPTLVFYLLHCHHARGYQAAVKLDACYDRARLHGLRSAARCAVHDVNAGLEARDRIRLVDVFEMTCAFPPASTADDGHHYIGKWLLALARVVLERAVCSSGDTAHGELDDEVAAALREPRAPPDGAVCATLASLAYRKAAAGTVAVDAHSGAMVRTPRNDTIFGDTFSSERYPQCVCVGPVADRGDNCPFGLSMLFLEQAVASRRDAIAAQGTIAAERLCGLWMNLHGLRVVANSLVEPVVQSPDPPAVHRGAPTVLPLRAMPRGQLVDVLIRLIAVASIQRVRECLWNANLSFVGLDGEALRDVVRNGIMASDPRLCMCATGAVGRAANTAATACSARPVEASAAAAASQCRAWAASRTKSVSHCVRAAACGGSVTLPPAYTYDARASAMPRPPHRFDRL